MRTAVKKQILKMPTAKAIKRWPISAQKIIEQFTKRQAFKSLAPQRRAIREALGFVKGVKENIDAQLNR